MLLQPVTISDISSSKLQTKWVLDVLRITPNPIGVNANFKLFPQIFQNAVEFFLGIENNRTSAEWRACAVGDNLIGVIQISRRATPASL